eukprot:CAMPEP_0168492084 /NCGR_PEP_ID=MMETSP0228-20121227/70027_1 /TAXON_ID=133427 /ORGANISM="Protoceratium reticulatum, Strain CCCM 535 (=CCMP 1889)" /LENGTH=58 /DNA_ID=CAMNT_0008508837 /DNA_START=22 /DNA_END=195 /DNA_ORIENTATION=+
MMVHTKVLSAASGGSHLPSSPTSRQSSAPSSDTQERPQGAAPEGEGAEASAPTLLRAR